MALFDLDLLGMTMQRMRHASARQQVVAENVAQADTPMYKARDIAGFSFADELRTLRDGRTGPGAQRADQLRQTSPSHLAGDVDATGHPAGPAKSWEILPSGNSVELEEQMLALNESKLVHDQAAAYYKKTTDLLRVAASGRF